MTSQADRDIPDLDALEALARAAFDAFLEWKLTPKATLWAKVNRTESAFRDGIDPDEVLWLIEQARKVRG